MEASEALIFGRRTRQGMAAAWPRRAGDPYAAKMNAITKYVAALTLTQDDLSWVSSHLLAPDDAIGRLRDLREKPAGPMRI